MTQEFVTLPRELVEQALKVLEYAANDVLTGRNAATALRAALEQPHTTEQSYMGCVTSDMHELAEWLNTMYEDSKEQIAALEQHQQESSRDNDLPRETGQLITSSSIAAPAGWKLVPVEPTDDMFFDPDYVCVNAAETPDAAFQRIYKNLLAAAPQPPVVEQSDGDTVPVPRSLLGATCAAINRKQDAPKLLEQLRRYTTGDLSTPAVEQPQGEQQPVAWMNATGGTTFDSFRASCWRDKGPVTPLYANPQPKRQPLTDEQSRRIYNSATYSASLAVFMTRIDAEHPDADDKGVSGWLQEAEDRVKHRTIDAAHEIGQAAAPQQGEQEPVAWLHQCNKRPDLIEMSFSKREPTLASKGYKARPLIFGDIAHPQPKRQPLTVEQIAAATGAKPGTPTWPLAVAFTRSIEAAHNIK